MTRFAHLSDLHIGKSEELDRNAETLAYAIERAGIEKVLVSGDITNRGLRSEHETFRRIFADAYARGAMLVVPGNHDRLGHDIAESLMEGARVRVEQSEGLSVLCVDSTADHNKSWLMPHGVLDAFDLAAADRAAARLDASTLRVLMLHHHPLPLPEDGHWERIGGWLRITQTRAAVNGDKLLAAIDGRCDLVLHGHRHIQRHVPKAAGGTPVDIYNAGSSTELCAFRVFEHEGATLTGVSWVSLNPVSVRHTLSRKRVHPKATEAFHGRHLTQG
jgi:Icc protein